MLDNPEITNVIDGEWVEEWRDETPNIYRQWITGKEIQKERDTPGIRIEDEWGNRPETKEDRRPS